ncbi:MAG: zinc ribbon domain-containing protein [Halopseudomonas sp.]
MPTYDYRCSTTGDVFEVRHSMSTEIQIWSELCHCIGRELGTTPADSLVERLATGGAVVQRGALSNPEAPPCASGGGCPGAGMCGV